MYHGVLKDLADSFWVHRVYLKYKLKLSLCSMAQTGALC